MNKIEIELNRLKLNNYDIDDYNKPVDYLLNDLIKFNKNKNSFVSLIKTFYSPFYNRYKCESQFDKQWYEKV